MFGASWDLGRSFASSWGISGYETKPVCLLPQGRAVGVGRIPGVLPQPAPPARPPQPTSPWLISGRKAREEREPGGAAMS
jgi:hypothetical protein